MIEQKLVTKIVSKILNLCLDGANKNSEPEDFNVVATKILFEQPKIVE